MCPYEVRKKEKKKRTLISNEHGPTWGAFRTSTAKKHRTEISLPRKLKRTLLSKEKGPTWEWKVGAFRTSTAKRPKTEISLPRIQKNTSVKRTRTHIGVGGRRF